MRNLSVCFLFLTPVFCFPQKALSPVQKCFTYESMQQFKLTHRGAETDAQFENWMTAKGVERKQSTQRTATVYTVPIIFHIVHNGEAIGTGSNLSPARVAQQLAQLNADFANTSGSAYSTAANTDIQFCAAVIGADGRGLAEPGIERINRNDRNWSAPPYDGSLANSFVDATIIPATLWDPYTYFNVCSLNLSGTLLGKATFPASSTLAGLGSGETDTHAGVIIHYASVGSVASPGAFGTAFGLGRTLTHEAGHYFGLRHIWGDGDCTATDYCNDTPPQDGFSTGCPAAGALNNYTPSVARMFDNYMDYTDDPCVNTFTAEQKGRMQTVMYYSPRRRELAYSMGCTTPASNSIRFSSTTARVTETGTGITCPGFKDVTVSITVFGAAGGNATVNLVKGGTMTENVDYTITPSSISFSNGDTASKLVTIRIWDDGAIEGTEALMLSYVITGTGVTAAGEKQTYGLIVADDDVVPLINNTGRVELLHEDFGTSGGALPAGGWFRGAFLPGNNKWVVSNNGGTGFTGQAAHITDNLATKTNTYDVHSPTDELLVTKLIDAAGYSNVKLSFTYKCDGERDAQDLYDFGRLCYSPDGYYYSPLPNAADGNADYRFQGVTGATSLEALPLPAFMDNRSFYLAFEWVNDNILGSGIGFTVDDVVVYAVAKKIESDAGHTGTQTLFAGQEAYISSAADDRIIAKIRNPSADVRCLTASVAEAGTAAVPLATGAGLFMRTQKVIGLSPGTPDSTATYEATFYFSTAELAAWGSNRLNLKILKVWDGVSLDNTLTAADAVVVVPTSVIENVAGGYITYTGNFTGFSQFMLVSPMFILPVNLITFEAHPAAKSIGLTWKTPAEHAGGGFGVERSVKGAAFELVGWVSGKGSGNVERAYAYTDRYVQPGITYRYRLNEILANGRQHYSLTREAKISGPAVEVRVSPNPATDKLNVFITGTGQPDDIELLNTQDQIVAAACNRDTSGKPYTLSVSKLPKGIYTLNVRLSATKETVQVLIR